MESMFTILEEVIIVRNDMIVMRGPVLEKRSCEWSKVEGSKNNA